MQFALETGTAINAITARAPGLVQVRDRSFTRSVILTARQVIDDWPPQDVQALSTTDLAQALALDPEILLLGTGERQVFPDPALYAFVTRAQVGFEVMDNGAACRTYNVLLHEGRNVALALLLPGVDPQR